MAAHPGEPTSTPLAATIPSTPPNALTPTEVSAPPATATPGEASRTLDVNWPKNKTLHAGDSGAIVVQLKRPDESAIAPLPEGNVQAFGGPSGTTVLIYFTPAVATLLTVELNPHGNFDVEYNPDPPQQKMVEGTRVLTWTIGIRPNKDAPSGRHANSVTLIMRQGLESGELPLSVRSEVARFDEKFYIVGPGGGSTFSDVMGVLKWALPGGLVPLVTGGLLLYFNRRNIGGLFKRNQGSSGKT